MKLLRRAAIVMVLFVLALGAFTARAASQTYTVQPGDTLFRIALQYGVTVDQLASVNGITDPTLIVVGQVLTIPDGATTPNLPANASAAAIPVYYTVQQGDTLNSIAQKFGVSWPDLVAANGLSDANHIEVGQTLTIPGASAPANSAATVPPTAAPNTAQTTTSQPTTAGAGGLSLPTGYRTHVVQPGEGLAAIAKQYKLSSWGTIAGANNITDPNSIYPGQTLIIPASDMNAAADTNAVDTGPLPPVTGKSITVILHEERVYAYQNGQLVRNVLVSTGLPDTPTVQGDYKIYTKVASQLMTGPGYYLPDVPWIMYFYEGYSFHGTYWHHNWGHPMSHGCVNMPTPEALWLYNWAEVGTPVHIQW